MPTGISAVRPSTMMVEVKSYLSRVLAPVGGSRVSPWNFDGGPHADTPAHYPSARHWSPDIRPGRWLTYLLYLTISLVLKGPAKRRMHDNAHRAPRRATRVSHHRIPRRVSNCSALLSRDHTSGTRARVLPHGATIVRRTDPDCESRRRRAAKGLASPAGTAERGRAWPSARRTCTSRRGSLRTPEPNVAATVTSPFVRLALRGVSRDHEKSRGALYTVWHEGCTLVIFLLSFPIVRDSP